VKKFNQVLNLLENAEVKVSIVADLESTPHIKADLKTVEKILRTVIGIIENNWRVNESVDTTEQERVPYQEPDNESCGTSVNCPPEVENEDV